ncbi:hypothetical protein BKD09_24035 [Bradyrhizobium japonicum]|uniref:Uncharacterized protein n=1 Tax=Bradyrhizobium japonicum TaxID=375 RepID=A0A1L3FDP8_BRAJP|nr:hypothetical protein [Bradyrhizobium japonicum]APG11408.1 hypothetical protein BKD09_24035 [Bradyrhizobium japonicum]
MDTSRVATTASYSDLLGFDPISNREPWVFSGVATDLLDTPQDLSSMSFSFDVSDPAGRVVLSATSANGKFFTVAHAGAIGWAFSAEELSELAGPYQARLEVSRDGASDSVYVGCLNILDGEEVDR